MVRETKPGKNRQTRPYAAIVCHQNRVDWRRLPMVGPRLVARRRLVVMDTSVAQGTARSSPEACPTEEDR